ncbi:MAG: hypothetical protein CIT03_05395 [Methanobacterium sp.]|nr:MAG: hypothetical protein CIT03_05395 [Methanobacterium sp.]
MKCKICENNLKNKVFLVKEMMFGFNEDFKYMECSKCGCLELINPPDDFSRYYNFDDYYSFKDDGRLKRLLKKKWVEYVLFKNSSIGRLLSLKFQKSFFDILALQNIDKKTRILDIGSGSGDLIIALNDMGFEKALGIDPYVKNESGCIKKNNIHQISNSEEFDLILFDHSFEHLIDHSSILKKVHDLLSPGGTCIIAMPIKNDYIWDIYGVNWVQIDAPRHILLHTRQSFDILLKKSSLKLQEVIYNSDEFFFYGSEQYKRGIALMDDESYLINPKKSIFTKKEIGEFKKKAQELNNKNLGDQCVFILNKIK